MLPNSTDAESEYFSILVVTDCYWVGGRETFISDNIKLLKSRGPHCITLLAGKIKNKSVDEVFDYHAQVEPNDCESLANWLSVADQLDKTAKPDFVWVHHFSVSHGYAVADYLGIPCHITLHGPLSYAKYKLPDALAFCLATNRGASVSVVSKEIGDELRSITDQLNITGLIHNRIYLEEPHTIPDKIVPMEIKNIRFVLFSRQQKLEHIRQSLILVQHFQKQGFSVKLKIFTGFTPHHDIQQDQPNKYMRFVSLLGKKWLLRNPGLFQIAKHVSISPLTNHVKNKMEQADVVLGMGRVSLEALSIGVPTILVGYEKVIGLITINNFEQYQESNFSGRGQVSEAIKDVVSTTITKLLSNGKERYELARKARIESSWPELKSVMKEAKSSSVIRADGDHLTIIGNVASSFKDTNLFEEISASLSDAEFETFSQLKRFSDNGDE